MINKIPDPDDFEDSGSGIFQFLYAMKKLVKCDVKLFFCWISNSVLNSQVCEWSHAISETPGPRIRMVKKYMELEQYGTDLICTTWDRAVLRIRIWDPQHWLCGYCKIRYRTFFLYSPRVFLSNMTVPYLFSLFATSFHVKYDGTVPVFFIRSVADPGSSAFLTPGYGSGTGKKYESGSATLTCGTVR